MLDVEVTTGEVNEGEQILARLDAAATRTGAPIAIVFQAMDAVHRQ